MTLNWQHCSTGEFRRMAYELLMSNRPTMLILPPGLTATQIAAVHKLAGWTV